MKYIATCVEQLDLAAVQLKHGTPAFGRFALILTDNIVELMLHQQCSDAILMDEALWKRSGTFTPEEKKAALGQDFPEKVKFCKNHSYITDDEAQVITICHRFRNVLYHAGIKHDPILNGLAHYYHNLACEVFGKLKPTSYPTSWDKASQIVQSYIVGNYPFLGPDEMPKLAKALADATPSRPMSLQEDLSAYMTQRIEELVASIDYMVMDHPNGWNENQIIEHIQVHDLIFGEESKFKAEVDLCKGPRDIDQLFQKVKSSGAVKLGRNHVDNWRKRAVGLEKVKDSNKALDKFNQLDIQMARFESLIHDAATTMAVELSD